MQTTFNLVLSLLLTKLCLDAATYCSALYQLFRQPETESRSVSTNMLINFALMLASAILAAWGGVSLLGLRVWQTVLAIVLSPVLPFALAALFGAGLSVILRRR